MSGVAAAVWAALSMSAAVPADPPSPPSTDVVVVEGRLPAPKERAAAASRFVDEVASESRRGRLTRWSGTICPGVAGVRERSAVAVAETVAREARALGLEVGAAGCKPDLLILVSRDPEAAVEKFRRDHRTFFALSARPEEFHSGPGRERFRDFLGSDAPVRWWHVSRLAAADGRPLDSYELKDADGNGTGVFRPLVWGTGASRLKTLMVEELARVLIVVDGRRLEGVRTDAFAAYVAFVALAELPPKPRPTAYPSILTLFDDLAAGRVAETGLTPWDRAYLCGLYEAPRDVRNVTAHKGAIRRRVVEASPENPPICPRAAT